MEPSRDGDCRRSVTTIHEDTVWWDAVNQRPAMLAKANSLLRSRAGHTPKTSFGSGLPAILWPWPTREKQGKMGAA